MKNLSHILLATFIVATMACKRETVDPFVDPPMPPTTEILEGTITGSKTLDPSIKYTLKNNVFVASGAELIIPAGTVIFGDKETKGTLFINRGGKISAKGTAASPVVFTSNAERGFRNTGDWGGVVLLGRGINNNGTDVSIEGLNVTAGTEEGKHGGSDANDNSGTLSFVRIEFAGIALTPGNEINSLTLGSVGAGTTLDHIQISYAGDDGIEFFGGSANLKYAVTYSTVDDDFDVDQGYSGKIQYGVAIRQFNTADLSGSRAIEASSNSDAAANPHTSGMFANMTFLGPKTFGSSASSDFKAGVHGDKNTQISVYNSVIAGWPNAVNFGGEGNGGMHLKGIAIVKNDNASSGTPKAASEFSYVTASALTDIFTTTPNYAAPAPADVTSTYLSGAETLPAGFEANNFYGAFGPTASNWNWNSGWLNFDPINTEY